MQSIGREFRSWVHAQRPGGHDAVVLSDDRVQFLAGELVAEVNIYPFEGEADVVEYLIARKDEEPVFFLHFALDDMARAQELFGQMAEALAEQEVRTTTRVLLCCTSALTTTMFADKMSRAAKTLSLDYEFSALPVECALKEGGEYSAVLLAPQVAHVRQQMMQAHPNAAVFEIPGKVFGSYNAGAALRLVLQALRDEHGGQKPDATLRAVRDLSDDRRVLIITVFSMRDHCRLGYRLYDRGVGITEGVVRKPFLDLRDIDDLMDTMGLHDVDVKSLDAVGIAVPGVTYRGVVSLPNVFEGDYELGVHLSRRFGIPVYVDNNCNAAAVGCYVSQDEVENLVFYRHAFGHEAGGFGTVIDGVLLKGRHNLAGEPKYFEHSFAFGVRYEECMWSEDGMHELAFNVICTSMALVAPDAVYLAVDTVDDAEEFRRMLGEVFEDVYIPAVHVVSDYVERVYLGTLAMTLQKLRNPNYRSLGVTAV